MGGGSWSAESYCSYAKSIGRSYDYSTRTLLNNYKSSSQAFVSRSLHKKLDPRNVVRECCDSTEHPNTIPIILALDVTGSMGKTAIAIQKQLNPIMEDIYANIKDAEIMVMAIGDLSYDDSPIQISQFESDIRIAENLDKIYFENGGGGNGWESYTAAWYMGSRHTKLDCWKRGKKGIIITLGDEPLNPYLPKEELENATGDKLQADVNTSDLYREASEKFDIYHFCVKSGNYPDQSYQKSSFVKVLGGENTVVTSVEDVHKKIVDVIKNFAEKNHSSGIIVESVKGPAIDNNGEIGW